MSDKDPRNTIEELEAGIQAKENIRTLELSKKNIPTAVILSILFPIGAYIYTKRWKAFGILFSALMGIAFVIILASGNKWSQKQEDDTGVFLSIIAAIVAPIDNASAIRRAKEKIEELKNDL